MPSLASYAKINLFLEVINKRPDGYHNIDSVFWETRLADTLTANATDACTITLTCDNQAVPLDENNLIIKAAQLLQRECAIKQGITFDLVKRIPMGGGFGGGSSNAAAALRLANSVWQAGLSDVELRSFAVRLGSDVPFFLHGGLCRCQGRGEIITPLNAFPIGLPLMLFATTLHSDTAEAYRGLTLPQPDTVKNADDFIKCLVTGDPEAIANAAFNRFETSVFNAMPELLAIQQRLSELLPFSPRLSGSGSGLWCIGKANEAKMIIYQDPFLRSVGERNGLRVVEA